jgi:hypothetical protein
MSEESTAQGEGRTPEQIATEIRDAIDELNSLLTRAGLADLKVEIEVKCLGIPDEITRMQTFLSLRGVYLLVSPTPRPAPPSPGRKRGHNS